MHNEAKRDRINTEDVVKVAGVWQWSFEPSASVWARGKYAQIRSLAANMGSECNQVGVLLFTSLKDDGHGALYTLSGVKDTDEAVQTMNRHAVGRRSHRRHAERRDSA